MAGTLSQTEYQDANKKLMADNQYAQDDLFSAMGHKLDDLGAGKDLKAIDTTTMDSMNDGTFGSNMGSFFDKVILLV